MMGFLAKMKASFPESMPLPEEFEKLFAWMQTNDFVRRYEDTKYAGREYATLYPIDVVDGDYSSITFAPVVPWAMSMSLWIDDPAVFERFAPFITTGSEGSEAGLWRDDEGRMKFVHLGSGSGSTMTCVLASDPVDFLRLLAIGYEELCWPDQYEMTPKEVLERQGRGGRSFVPPLRFRAWVEETFRVAIPRTASEIVARIPSMDGDDSNDPFRCWIRKQEHW
jgi:hypothetical protein